MSQDWCPSEIVHRALVEPHTDVSWNQRPILVVLWAPNGANQDTTVAGPLLSKPMGQGEATRAKDRETWLHKYGETAEMGTRSKRLPRNTHTQTHTLQPAPGLSGGSSRCQRWRRRSHVLYILVQSILKMSCFCRLRLRTLCTSNEALKEGYNRRTQIEERLVNFIFRKEET